MTPTPVPFASFSPVQTPAPSAPPGNMPSGVPEKENPTDSTSVAFADFLASLLQFVNGGESGVPTESTFQGSELVPAASGKTPCADGDPATPETLLLAALAAMPAAPQNGTSTSAPAVEPEADGSVPAESGRTSAPTAGAAIPATSEKTALVGNAPDASGTPDGNVAGSAAAVDPEIPEMAAAKANGPAATAAKATAGEAPSPSSSPRPADAAPGPETAVTAEAEEGPPVHAKTATVPGQAAKADAGVSHETASQAVPGSVGSAAGQATSKDAPLHAALETQETAGRLASIQTGTQSRSQEDGTRKKDAAEGQNNPAINDEETSASADDPAFSLASEGDGEEMSLTGTERSQGRPGQVHGRDGTHTVTRTDGGSETAESAEHSRMAGAHQSGHKASQVAETARPTTLPRPVQNGVVNQLVDRAVFLQRNGQSEVRIDLEPETLGRIQMKISTEHHRVTVHLLAETHMAREVIEANLGQLRADLAQQGLEIDSFDVGAFASNDQQGTGASGQNRPGAKFAQSQGRSVVGGIDASVASRPAAAGSDRSVDYFA